MPRTKGLALLASGVLFGVLLTVEAAAFTFTTIDFPGATLTQAFGINNAGQIVGAYTDSSGANHGFLLSGGTFTTVDFPGASGTEALGINNNGQIVGVYSPPSGGLNGFLLSGGSFSTIQFQDAVLTFALGINDSGVIVGICETPNSVAHACPTFIGVAPGWILSGGAFTFVNASSLGAIGTDARGINNAGQIVGIFEEGSGRLRGYLLAGGSYSAVDFPGAAHTEVFGINNLGQIVGRFDFRHGFLDSGGSFTTVDPPGSTNTVANGINDSGSIVGHFQDGAGKFHGFLATALVPFAVFSAQVELNVVAGKFEVEGTFTLGSGSNGINPPGETVSLQVGTFSTTIPAGSFTQDEEGGFKFEGVINGVTLEVKIMPLGGDTFAFEAEGTGANLTGTVNPVTVGLTIGDDGGTTTVTAEFD